MSEPIAQPVDAVGRAGAEGGGVSPEPLMAIPLDYAANDLRPSRTGTLKAFALLGWSCVAITPIAMAAFTTEFIILTGSALAVCGVALLVAGAVSRRRFAAGIGIAYLLLAVVVFLLINLRDWSPSEAHGPVFAIACVATAGFGIAVWRLFRRTEAVEAWLGDPVMQAGRAARDA